MQIAGKEIVPGKLNRIKITVATLPSLTTIDVPIVVNLSKKPGPKVLLTGGVHGNELNGMEIVRRVILNTKTKVKAGGIICIPCVNIPGLITKSREFPDGKDLNRSFPGSKLGSLASRIAHLLMTEFVPKVQYLIDFHTGGSSRSNVPQMRCNYLDPIVKELTEIFAPKFVLQAPHRDKSFRMNVANLGKTALLFEGGESLRFDPESIENGVNGTLRVLKHLGIIKDAPVATHKPIYATKSSWLRAKRTGFFQPMIKNGAEVVKGQIIGQLTDIAGEYTWKVRAHQSGFIICFNNLPLINRGEAIVHILQKENS